MKTNLIIQALMKGLSGLILVGLLLFLPAGTFAFWNAWLFIALLFVPMLLLGVILLLKAPELLAKRLNNKENEGAQKKVVGLTALLFLVGFVLTGLDFRFGWSKLPLWLVVVASVLFLIGYGLYAEVMRENAYLSRTVEIQENQKVKDKSNYDRLIQLCDAISFPTGPTYIEKRLVDVVLRRGFNDLTIPKWKAFLETKQYFDGKTGGDIYRLFDI